MSTTFPDLDDLLLEGIAAIERGDRERGQTLLLQVVERNDGIEQAWWWLSLAVRDPQDQITALENVLTLNSDHAQARTRLAQLREQKTRLPEPEWKSLLPEAPQEEPDADNDSPYQCPYCGRVTDEAARRCPNCGRGVWRRVSKSTGSGMFRLLQLALGGMLALALIDTLSPLFALSAAQPARPDAGLGVTLIADVFGVTAFLGDFLNLNPDTARWILTALLLRAAGLFVLLIGLSARWAMAYYATLLALIADVTWNIYLLFTGGLGVVGAAVNIVLALGVMLLLFACAYEFPINDERILVKADTRARSAADFYMLGHRYQQQGMKALAVAQWRRAVGLAPTMTVYYKDLGIGYAQLNRFARSLRALREAQRLEPDNTSIAEVMELVNERQAAYQKARRPKS
jgi:tetratricopeptide (TPR) repeat protein